MTDPALSETPIIPYHQWTHDGTEVLIVKQVGKDGSTSRGFVWPLTVGAPAESLNWSPEPTCNSGGLFGWAWGIGIGDGKVPLRDMPWLVFAADPSDVILIDAKVKAAKGRVVHVGDWQSATSFVLAGQIAWIHHASSGAASATGWSGTASATGERGAASATGGRGAASATGESSLAGVTGLSGRVRCGVFGALALAWLNSARNRTEMRVAVTGCGDGTDGLLKANQWYELNEAGAFVEVVV